jgi:uncharacterized protein (TIGR02646 family)
MKRIVKGNEPNKLLEYRNTVDASYRNMLTDVKDVIRKQLLEEQGYLCIYCLSRIPQKNRQIKIEHFLPESGETLSEELSYKNLFAVCDGNEGSPFPDQHCDTRKGNRLISLNPLDENVERQFVYEQSGYLRAKDEGKQVEVDDILNLNINTLVNSRKKLIEGTRKHLLKIKKQGIWSNQLLQKEIDKLYEKNSEGKFVPYCMAAIQYLGSKMK